MIVPVGGSHHIYIAGGGGQYDSTSGRGPSLASRKYVRGNKSKEWCKKEMAQDSVIRFFSRWLTQVLD